MVSWWTHRNPITVGTEKLYGNAVDASCYARVTGIPGDDRDLADTLGVALIRLGRW
jgi:hypothetical protein